MQISTDLISSDSIVYMVPIRLAQITKKFGHGYNSAVPFCPFKMFGEPLHFFVV